MDRRVVSQSNWIVANQIMILNNIHMTYVIHSNWIEIILHKIGHKYMIDLPNTWTEISFNIVELHIIHKC